MGRPVLYSLRSEVPEGAAAQAPLALDSGFDGVECAAACAAALGGMPIRALTGVCVSTEPERAVEDVTAMLTRATAVGAICLNVTLPTLAAEGGPGDGFRRYQDAINLLHELLHSVRHEAEPAGVAVAIRAPMGGCFLSPVELREVVDGTNSWAVGVGVEVDGVARIGSPVDWIATLGHRVRSVRLRPSVSDDGSSSESRSRTGPEGLVDMLRAMERVPDEWPVILDGDAEPRSAWAWWGPALPRLRRRSAEPPWQTAPIATRLDPP